MSTKETSPNEAKTPVRPYSCMGCPPVSDNNGEKKQPTDVAKEFHEKHVLVSVADMRGQF